MRGFYNEYPWDGLDCVVFSMASSSVGVSSGGSLRIIYADAPKETMDELVAASGRALRAHGKGELPHLHDVAQAIRTDVAAKSPGGWHIIVGGSFGSFVTHEAGNMAYFFLGHTGVLAFKHG